MHALAENMPTRSQAERAYWMLAERIMRLDLAPGTILMDKDLTRELGIGRTPVREALQRLAGEGLVTHFPHRGMVVSQITETSTRDIYEFRSLIDGEAVRRAAMRRTGDEAAEFTRLAALMADHAGGSDVDLYIRTDRAFYEQIGIACRNRYLAETVPRIFNMHVRLWFYLSRIEGDWHRLAGVHSRMIEETAEAIERKDPDAAALAVRAYIAQRHKEMRATA